MNYLIKRTTALVGHYGCGKTNLAVNLAQFLAGKGKVSIIDMDIVNPYFRTADFTEVLRKQGINVVCPGYAGTNLDIPVLNFDVESIADNSDYTIIDVGGSDSGAFAIGKYRDYFERQGNNFDLLYVFNKYRNCSAVETAEMMREIETACRFRCTGIVNNSNLGVETTPELVAESEDFAEEVSRLTGLPIVFTCVTEKEKPGERQFPVRREVVLPWEKN